MVVGNQAFMVAAVIIKTMNSVIEGSADQNGRVKEVQSPASIDPLIHPSIQLF